MTLFDVKCLIYGKIDVFRNISSCRLHTKLYKLFFVIFYLSAISGRSALRSAVRGDLVVPSHRTDWGSRAFAVAGPSCYWNELPVELRDLTVSSATFAKHLKTHLFTDVFF